MTPSIRLRSVVLDCPDARALARFYAGFAGGTPEDADPEWVVLRLPDGPRICFQRAPGHVPPAGPVRGGGLPRLRGPERSQLAVLA
ncbi:hypothetical protein P3T26_006411 [Streptomyces sp. MAA16]|nr:hypothetical protein [Streptomyces sp. MAA16]